MQFLGICAMGCLGCFDEEENVGSKGLYQDLYTKKEYSIDYNDEKIEHIYNFEKKVIIKSESEKKKIEIQLDYEHLIKEIWKDTSEHLKLETKENILSEKLYGKTLLLARKYYLKNEQLNHKTKLKAVDTYKEVVEKGVKGVKNLLEEYKWLNIDSMPLSSKYYDHLAEELLNIS